MSASITLALESSFAGCKYKKVDATNEPTHSHEPIVSTPVASAPPLQENLDMRRLLSNKDIGAVDSDAILTIDCSWFPDGLTLSSLVDYYHGHSIKQTITPYTGCNRKELLEHLTDPVQYDYFDFDEKNQEWRVNEALLPSVWTQTGTTKWHSNIAFTVKQFFEFVPGDVQSRQASVKRAQGFDYIHKCVKSFVTYYDIGCSSFKKTDSGSKVAPIADTSQITVEGRRKYLENIKHFESRTKLTHTVPETTSFIYSLGLRKIDQKKEMKKIETLLEKMNSQDQSQLSEIEQNFIIAWSQYLEQWKSLPQDEQNTIRNVVAVEGKVK